MKRYSPVAAVLCLASLNVMAQTVIRQGGFPGKYPSMPQATLDAIPDLVLPAQYKDRTAHPLPAAVDNSKQKYFPPYSWSINGYTCAHAVAVSYIFDFEANFTKGVASSTANPDYPFDYTYAFLDGGNWSKGGDGWSIVEALAVIRQTGVPTTADFGRFAGSNAAWMSGYDKYYAAMKLRGQDHKIDFSPAGNDEVIKQYLYDHMDGSAAGGLLGMIVNDGSWATGAKVNGIPVFTKLGPGGGHALSVIGYDNSVAGGSYLICGNWGEGFYWAPYSLFRSGAGLWPQNKADPNYDAQYDNNHYFFTTRIKKNYSPKFTFKINLSHSDRSQICLMTGAANSTTAAEPSTVMDYQGAFNYAGGAGVLTNLEIGLDLTDLSSVVAAGQGTFFLKVLSKGGTGTINSIALEDYTGATVKEIPGTGKAISGTTLIAIPWSGSAFTGIGNSESGVTNRGGALRADYLPGTHAVRFSFPAEAAKGATLRIKDLFGATVLTRASSPAITPALSSDGATVTMLWDLKDDQGRISAPGIYFATLTSTGSDRRMRHLDAKVVVGN